MKNKFNTATFLRQLTLTLLVAMLAAAFQTARAQESQVEYPEYITEVIVVGGTKDETNTAKDTYEKKGYTFCAMDLNAGCGSSSDYIYLGYKTESRANTNGGYITDFVVRNGSNPPATISYNGRTYSLCPYDGGDHFKEITGNLNSHVSSGWNLYLYYTKDNYDKRAVNSITFNNTKSGAVDLTESGTGGIDLNAGCGANTDNIYMHITTDTKSNRPSNDPVMASGLTFNGSAQTLLSINNTNTGTMMYSVNGGGFSSTIPTATDAGNYTVKYYAASNDYGDQSDEHYQTVSIAKATNNKVTTTEALNLTYNGSAQNLINAYSATFGTVQYSLDGTNYSATVPKGKDAKDYTIYYKVEGTSNYNGVSGTAKATIKKAANSVAITEALDLTYNGSAQNLIDPYIATDGVVLYSLDNTTFSSDIPQATGAKDYTIYYKVAETPNYNGVSGTATATIKKAANNNATVSIANSIDGKANVNPTVTDNLSSGTITYQYSTSSNSDFSTAKPNAPGTWYVIATIAADDNYEEYTTAPQNFILIDWEGDGTSSSPYLIKSTTDLDLLATKVNSGNAYEGKYFKLGANITYSYTGLGETESNFTAIGNRNNPFNGNFDGDGKTISGIRIYKPNDNYHGLFGCIRAAIVENIILTDTKITGSDAVGGIVGCSNGGTGTIRNCIVADNVYINANFTCGGIVGINYGSLSNNLVVNASSTNGAIVGRNVYATPINNFYYNCTVKGVNNATNVGGGDGDIEDQNGALQAVQISADEGITFEITSNNAITYGNQIYAAEGATVTFKITDIYKPDEGYTVSGYTYAEGKSLTKNADGNYTFTVPSDDVTISRDITDVWNVENDADGSAAHPYIIMNPAGLDLLATNVNNGNDYAGKYFKLGADITYSYAGLEETGSNFTAIGNSNNPFNGNFDGDGKTISGIRIYKKYTNCHGLFGFIREAIVENIILTDTKITGSGDVGGIVGYSSGGSTGTIRNCIVADNVYINADNKCGGIVGVNYGYLSNNLVVNAEINSSTNGAIVGRNVYATPINNFYYNTTVKGVNNATNVGGGDGDITDNNGAVHIDLLIDGESTESVSVAPGTYQKVLYRRNITAGIPTTIMLPFDFDASAFDGGKFYTFTGINTETWEATMTETTSTLYANTPYIYIADKNMTSVVFAGVTIEKTEAGNVEKTDWTFQGTYEKKVWNTNGEIETKNVYGFAAKAGTNQDNENYAAGEFVRARYNVSIKPTRAYLQYTGNDENLSKSALVLPDRIKVVFIDKETASVIDDPTVNPSENEDGDITTPTSEIQPTANVKVWSYDKTIFIQARPGTDYRIIDASGRTLRTAAILTDRDEIRLGSHRGIAIVIINGKTYKVIY